MKIKEIAQKKDKDLDKFIEAQKESLLKLSFGIATKESNKVRDIRKIKKDIARALTVKKERELSSEEVKEVEDKKDNIKK